MNVPKVYFNNHTAKWDYERQNNDDTEYIRADLTEPTWEDIRQLFKIADNYESELNRHKYLSEKYCKEVLRRFLESKKEIEL